MPCIAQTAGDAAEPLGALCPPAWRLPAPVVLVATLAVAVPLLLAAEDASGLELLRAGRVDDALAFFQGELRSNPDDVTAMNMVGAILCLQNDPESSVPYFQRALQHAPGFVPARKNLAIAEFELGRYAAAEANLKQLLEVAEARSQASLFLGMIASDSGQHGKAVQLFRDAGDFVAAQPRALIAYARSLLRLGQAEGARDVLAAARARSDLTGQDFVDSAQVAAALGLFDEALADLERAEAADSSLQGLGRRRVEVLAGAGRAEEALALTRELASETPGGELLSLVAELAERAGDRDGAIDALRRRIQHEPASERGYIALSEFCARHRNPELALEVLDLGLSRLPKSYRLLVQKGITLGQGQRYEDARLAFSDAVALTPDHSVALTAFAVTLILSDEMPEALQALRAGLERFPDDFYMHYIYGFALERSQADNLAQGQRSLAEKHLQRSIELNDEFPGAYYRLGKLLADRDLPRAIRNLETAVRLDPQLTAAKYQLGQLYLDNGRSEDGARLMHEVGEAKQQALEQEQMPQFRVFKAPPPP